ncbi:polysaccharide deacetylase family protein [bacterium]|nr:polysaccharide deacetylase family protein [bacterium]
MPLGEALAPEEAQNALPALAASQKATGAAADWAVPQRYQGKRISTRVRYFPHKLLALTFDDGPNPELTPTVLKTLAEHGAHATFFVLGRAAHAHPELLRAIVAGGHTLGSHSYTHPSTCTAEEARSELARTAAAIREATGERPTCFRPPYGIVDSKLTHLALSQGYCVFTWTISSADTAKIDAAGIAHNVIHTPNPGDIVLMHDGPGHRETVKALPQILSELGAAGFRFVSLPELLRAWDQWLASSRAKASQGAASSPLKGGAATTQ